MPSAAMSMGASDPALSVRRRIARERDLPGYDSLEAFNAAVRKIPEVEECYMIAGGFDYQLKIRTRDMPHFRDVMATSISTLPHVSSTNSYVAMEAVVEQGWGMAE